MKKTIVLFALVSMSAFAAEFSGTLADSKCGAKHVKATAADAACAQKCVKGGADAVLVTSGDKILKIDAASKDKVMPFLGKKVTISGSEADGVLTVDSVQ